MNLKNVSIGLILALGLATGVAAQQSTAKQTPAPKSTETKAKKPATGAAKLTGCIERGPAATGNSTVTPPGNPPPPPMYKLTHVDSTALKDALSNPDTKTSADISPSTEIGLRADSKINLSEHVDHKVELTGKMVSGKAETKSTGGATAQTAGINISHVFQVTSVKMLASTCQ